MFHYFGGGVSITLPVRDRNEGNVAAATATAQAAVRSVEFAVLTAQQQIGAAFTQYEAARRSLDIYERGVRDVSRRNLDVIRQAYQLGRGSLLHVIAEQRRYIEVENTHTEALKQVYDAAVDLEIAPCRPAAGARRVPAPAGDRSGVESDEVMEVSLTPEEVERAIKTLPVRGVPASSAIAAPGAVTSSAYRDTKVNALVGGVVRQVRSGASRKALSPFQAIWAHPRAEKEDRLRGSSRQEAPAPAPLDMGRDPQRAVGRRSGLP